MDRQSNSEETLKRNKKLRLQEDQDEPRIKKPKPSLTNAQADLAAAEQKRLFEEAYERTEEIGVPIEPRMLSYEFQK